MAKQNRIIFLGTVDSLSSHREYGSACTISTRSGITTISLKAIDGRDALKIGSRIYCEGTLKGKVIHAESVQLLS